MSLVIGGGAMRGAVAWGMLTALEEAGASDVFDHVYGASAGATNGAIFLARQCGTMLPIFLERLAKRKFVRMTRRGLYVDIPLVYQKILKEEMPLDAARIRAHRTVLHIAATGVDTGAYRWFTNHDSVDILSVLQASAAIPVFYNIPVVVGSRKYLDGGIAEPLAVAHAMREGATHVLVLATVPETYRAVNRHPLVERWARRRIRKFGVGFRQVYAQRYHAFNRSLDIAFDRVFRPPGMSVLTVAPHTLVGWAERRKRRLTQAVEEGKREMEKALGI